MRVKVRFRSTINRSGPVNMNREIEPLHLNCEHAHVLLLKTQSLHSHSPSPEHDDVRYTPPELEKGEQAGTNGWAVVRLRKKEYKADRIGGTNHCKHATYTRSRSLPCVVGG